MTHEFNQDELIKASQEMFTKHNRAVKMPDFDDYKPSLWSRCTDWIEKNNPFGASIFKMCSVEEYLALPYRERHVWLFWYKRVYLSADGTRGSFILGRKSEREKLENYLASRYPVQYFLRETGFTLRVRFDNFRQWVRNTLKPRQRWLTKQISNGWTDKTTLIPDLNFAMVVHFVEGENCFDHTDYAASGEVHDVFAKELRECYDYIKNVRPKLQHGIDNSYPDEETMTGNYYVDYAEHIKFETELNQTDTKWLVWIVTNRDFFWT